MKSIINSKDIVQQLVEKSKTTTGDDPASAHLTQRMQGLYEKIQDDIRHQEWRMMRLMGPIYDKQNEEWNNSLK